MVLRKLFALGAILCPSLAAMGAALPGQPARFDLGVDVRGVTSFQRNTTTDLEWDFAAATSDGVKIIESSATAPGGYVVYTLADATQSTAGQDVVAIANPDTSGDGTRELAWIVRTGGGYKLWCAYFEGAGIQFPCTGQQDLGGGGVGTVVAAAGYLDGGIQQDLVVLAGGQIDTMLSSGPGFGAAVTTVLAGPGAGLAVGEFTGDGFDDIAVSVGTDLVTFQTTAGGALQPLQVLPVGAALGRIASGDIDGNGVADLAIADAAGTTVRIIDGSPSNPPHSLGQVLAPFPAGLGITAVYDVTLDDADGDGDADLAVAADDWIVLEPNSSGNFAYGDSLPGLGRPTQLIATNTHTKLGQGGMQSVIIYKRNQGGSYLDGDTLLVGRGALASQPPEARAYSANGAPMTAGLRPYGAASWGTNVGAGNIAAQPDPALGRDVEEALFGPGPGPQYGPQIRGYRPASDAFIPKVNFYAYGTLRFGASVAAGDIDADGAAEIVSGAGAGAVFGPHVRAFRFDGSTLQSAPKVSFFAYSTLKYGVNPSAGTIDGDLPAEIVTGPGPGAMFSPQVRGWNYDGGTLTSIGKVNFNAFGVPRFGARVANGDFDRDGMTEIAASPGPGGTSEFEASFRGFDFDGSAVKALPGFDITASALPSSYGAIPAAVQVSATNGDLLVGGAGPQPGLPSRIVGWTYDAGSLRPVSQLDFQGFTPSEGGAAVAGGAFF
ncbi:MAG: hypothetical protein U0166_20860 [Acidobacteriota bacterium]